MPKRTVPADTPLLELTGARVVRDRREDPGGYRAVRAVARRARRRARPERGRQVDLRRPAHPRRPIAPQDPTAPPPVRLAGSALWNLFDARELLGVVSASLQSTYDLPVSVRDAVLSVLLGSTSAFGSRTTLPPSRSQRAEELLAEVGASELADRRLDTLSTGEARRALVARALINDPPVLVLDEPCATALDPAMTWRFLEGTVRPLARSGRTLLLVTHHVDDIVPEIDRVVLLSEGRVVDDGPKAEILNVERLSALYGFDARVEQHGGWYRLWWGDE